MGKPIPNLMQQQEAPRTDRPRITEGGGTHE